MKQAPTTPQLPKGRRQLPLLLAALVGIVLPAQAVEDAAANWLDQDLPALLSKPNRLAGTPDGWASGDYLLGRLRQLSGEVFVQRFWFPQEITTECALTVAGRQLALSPFRANGLQPANTGSDGIRGPLVYLGRGGRESLHGRDLEGSIAVIDFETDGLAAFAFGAGARAVICVGDPGMSRQWSTDKASFVSADLPRFYVSRSEAGRFGLKQAEGTEATLRAQVRWEQREGRNIFFCVPGTQPGFGGADEIVIVSAPYDTAGIVPTNSPSPDRATNVAGLLALAAQTSAAPGRRGVLFAFFDNHANFDEGARQFYAALRRANPSGIIDPLSVRLASVSAERKLLNDRLTELAHPDVLARRNPTADGIRAALRTSAKVRYDELQERSGGLRMEQRSRKAKGGETLELDREIESVKETRRMWQEVREAVRDRRIVAPEHAAAWEEARDALVVSVRARLTELDSVEKNLADSIALTDRLAGQLPVLHVALRFTSGNSAWTLLPSGRQRMALVEAMATLPVPAGAEQAPASWFNRPATALASVQWRTIEASAFAQAFGIPAVTAVTEQDRAAGAEMPDVELAEGGRRNLRLQLEALTPYLRLILDLPEASAPDRMLSRTRILLDDYIWLGDRAEGHATKRIGFGETAPSESVPGAIIQIMQRVSEPLASTPRYITRSDANGIFPLTPILREEPANMRNLVIEAATFDPDGKILSQSSLTPSGPRGSVEAGWTSPGFFQTKSDTGFYNVLALFSGQRGVLVGGDLPFVGRFAPRGFLFLNSLTESPFQNLNFQFDMLGGVGAYMALPRKAPKVIYRDPASPDGVALYLDAPDRFLEGGEGGPVRVWNLARDMAPPMNALNEQRLQGLRRRHIILDAMEELHLAATGQLEAAGKAGTARDPVAAFQADGRSASLERRVYRPLRETIGDMLSAITVLLVLAVPFAAALQALVFPSKNIYRRVGLFAGIFLACFLALYFTHPAFSFSSFPVVILLAFILMVISGAVIGIITSKFSHEIKGMQGLVISAHTMRKSVVGNFGAAFSLAISTMRRRPSRTALTVITVLLLTFTILSFVSFQSEKGVAETRLGASSQPGDLVLLRNPAWNPLPADLRLRVEALVGEQAAVAPRFWQAQELTSNLGEELAIPIRGAEGLAEAHAVLGLSQSEVSRFPALAEALGVDASTRQALLDGEGILLSPSMATQLGVQAGAEVRLLGRAARVLGVFDPQKLQEVRQIDGAPVLPINFRSTRLAMGEFEAAGSAAGGAGNELEKEIAKLEPDAFEPVGAGSVVLMGEPLARDLGVPLRALSVFDDEDPARTARQLAILSDASTYLQAGGERRWLRFGDLLGVTGLGDVAIPLLVGGLIVFSTMLGSILDREKEIYTFSALGLAPRNIAMLFFVEAGIYAILGGFGGYLLGQGATLALQALASTGLLVAPEVNYSSSTAINTILLVIVVVMASTAYPALQAARKATADTSRRWKIPAPENNTVRATFPFTIASEQVGGVLGYVKEFLDNHADRTIGSFAASDACVRADPDAGTGTLTARIWLQPFDQGISQVFEIAAAPSDIEGISEIAIRATRTAGPPGVWQRALPGFLELMRKEFLLWRTLPDDVVDHYLLAAEDKLVSPPTTHI